MPQVQESLLESGAKEVWKVIPSAPEYVINEYGQIKRLTKAQGTFVGKTLKPSGKRYLRINLVVDGKRISEFVHNLVAEAFIGPKPLNCTTHHRDEIKKNNYYRNLEYWDTHTHKVFHRKNQQLPNGEKHYNAKLTEQQVKEIRTKYMGIIYLTPERRVNNASKPVTT